MSTYCTRANIEDLYGVKNTVKYADLDDDESAVKIAARIERAIAVASADIDSFAMCASYAVPLKTAAGATPTLIENLCAALAGLWLYEALGSEQTDPRSGQAVHRYAFRQAWAHRVLDEIGTGRRRLDALKG